MAHRKCEVARYLASHMGVTDPCNGIDTDPLDKAPDNTGSNATLTSVGIAKQRYPSGRPGLSSLHDGCAKGSVEAVQSLLDRGADINGHNAGHETALLVALWHEKFEVARVLTKYSADGGSLNRNHHHGWFSSAKSWGKC